MRLRTENNKHVLTFKGPSEIESKMKIREEFEVEDFDKMAEILKKAGFTPKVLFNKKRKHYELGDTCFEIDELEGFPPYLEIETKSEKSMEKVCKKLDLDISKGDSRIIMEIWPEKFR